VDAGLQFLTMVGMLRTLPRLMAWALRLAWQDIRRHRRAPGSSYPLRQATPPDSTGEPAAGRRGILRELQGAESGLPL